MNTAQSARVIGLVAIACCVVFGVGALTVTGGLSGSNGPGVVVDDGEVGEDASKPSLERIGGADRTVDGSSTRIGLADEFSQTAASGDLGPNLLDNPTCTVGGQGEGEEPLYWTVEQGEIECNEPEPQFMPEPIVGEYVFIDWEDLEPTTDESIVTQTVPVTGGSEYQFSVWVGSDEVDDDYAQFQVQFLDGGTPISEGIIDSGEFQPEDPNEPDQYVETTQAPENADEAVVRIILVNGGDFGLDRPLLWADEVQFQEFSDAPTAFDVSGVETGIEQTLAPDWTLFDDEFGEDEDDRGFDDDAEISHFGGGDLGGSVTDNAAGETVGLAGGDLQVNADGSFSVTNPTQTGTFEFEYRLEYEGDHDDATVELEIFDHELENPLCEEWDENAQDQPIGWDGEDFSCHDLEDPPFKDTDHTAVGERSFTDNYLSLDDEVHTEQTVYVVGEETYTVSGLYGTDSEDYSGTVEFEYLDSDGDVIADEGFTLEALQSESTTDFDRFTETTDAPDDAKRATLRLTIIRPSGHEHESGVYFDDFSIERGDPGEDPVNARDVETEVGIYHAFEPSDTLFDDWGNGLDELGTPHADLVNFGGGDLSGSVTDHGPGESVSFAGGTLTVESDGSFSLEEPTDVGTHTFEYEIENEHDSSTATVEIWVRDSTLLDADCDPDTFEAWDDVSPGNGNIDCLDPQESGTAQPNGEQNPPVPPYAIGDRGGDGYDAIGEQTVPVRGGYTYELAGFVGTEATPEDSYVTLEVDYLDADGTELTVSGGDDVDLSEMRSEGTTEFDAFSDTTVPPEEATHATVRIFIHSPEEMDLGGDAYARAYVDDLSFELLGTPPEANDADLEVDAADTLTASILSDHGYGADALGEPEADVVSFGGADLGGDATEHNAGQTTALAGGDLTIESDGSLELVAPIEPGTFAFDYRLENDAGYDEATVTIEVIDQSFFEVSIDETNAPILAGETLSIDAGIENTGDNDGTRTVTVEIEDEDETVVFDDDQELSLGEGVSDTVSFDWETAVDDGGEYDVTVSTGDDDATEPITVFAHVEVDGTVVDANDWRGDGAIADADVTFRYPDGTEIETTTNEDGEFTVADVPGTGEEYELDVSADGYHTNETTITVTDEESVFDAGEIELDGTASVSGVLEDALFESGVENVDVYLTTDAVEYRLMTDEDGAFEVKNVGGTGEEYELEVFAGGYDDPDTPETVVENGDEIDLGTIDLDGVNTLELTVEDEETGDRIEGADVTLEHRGPSDLGTVTLTDVTDSDGSGSIDGLRVVGGGEEYTVTAVASGYSPKSSEFVASGETSFQDLSLSGNASVSGTVEDATLEGIPEVDVTLSNGGLEFTATTDEDGEYTIENVPGTGAEYTVSADPGSWNENSTTVTVGDGEAAQADLTLTGPRTNTVEVHDRLIENAGGEYRIGNATVVIEHYAGGAGPTFGEGTVTTGSDGSSVDVALPTMPTHLAPGGTLGDDELRYTASADGYEPHTNWESLDTDVAVRVTIGGTAEVSGTVVDAETGEGIEDATIAIEYPSGETVTLDDAIGADGTYTIEDVPGTGEEYEFTVSADGYDSNATVVTVGDGETIGHDVELAGTASVSGTIEDTTFETGVEGIDVAVENGLGTYTAETNENGEYTVENVRGTGESYTVSVDPTGWDENSTTVTIGDGDDVTGVVLEITGDARDSITLSDWETGTPLEGTTVRIEHGTFGVAEDAFTADGDGNMEIVLPGGYTYGYTFSQPGYDPAEIPLRSFDPGDKMSANYVLGGNAEITGQITDAETGEGVDGATVTATNGAGAYDATTDEEGAYTIENVPGGHDYDVTIDADGYEAVVESDESVGDEATHTLDAELTGNATIEGTVEDERTGAGLENADVTVVYPADGAFTVEDATDADGEFSIENVPGTDEEYTVVAQAPGYEAGNTTVTMNDGALAEAGTIELAGNAAVSGTVEDAAFESGVPDVEVTVSDGQAEYTARTDENGEYTVENVRGTGESYTVSTDPVGWDGESRDESIGDGAELTDVDFVLTGNASVEFEVRELLTATDLEGASVTIDHETLGTATELTNESGYVSFAVPADQDHEYTVSKAGYEAQHGAFMLPEGGYFEGIRFLAGTGSLSGKISDAATSEPIEDADLVLEYPSGETVVFENATDADGEYTIEDVPGTGAEYTVHASADGYDSNATTTVVGDEETVEDVTVRLNGTASVSGTVSDVTFETGIEGIEVAVENGLGTYTAETDENGEYTVENVRGTGESYTVSVDPDGWDANSTTVTVGDGDDVTGVSLEITGDTRDTITLSDWETGAPLEGATVSIEHETFGVAEDAFTADGDGEMEIVLPGGFTYGYTFSQPGYDPADIPSRSLDSGDDMSANYVLGGNAEITGQITDSESGDGIEGVTVTATNGAGAYDATTDENGEYTIELVPGGNDYDVAIEADGYETNVEADESVGDEATHTLDAELTGTATLSGTVTDGTFEVDLDGVEVGISGDQEYVVETDENGEYTAIVAGTGEEYTVTVDPDGWIEASETVELGDGETETGFDFELAGDAAIELTVEDAETGSPIDGAAVIVTNGTLGESDSFETDGDGVAEVTPLPGGFTYAFTVDADGYDSDELTDVFLTDGASEGQTHGLFGNAEISGQVTDDVFGAPVEGVTVTAENGVGTYDATTDEAGEYTIENVPGIGEEYDLTIDEEGYELVEETVTVGDEATVVRDLSVSGDAELTGAVTDVLTEDAIEGVIVTAENGAGSYDATTDEAGEYTIENVPGGETYELVADHDGYEQKARDGVLVGTGSQQTENLALEPIGEATVTGTVADEVTGEPIAGADVTLEVDDEAVLVDLVYETTTDADGEYEVDGAVGGYEYVVQSVATGYADGTTSGAVGADGVTELDVTALGNASVSGIVTDAVTGDGIADSSVTLSGEQGEYVAVADGSGAFTVEYVPGTGEGYGASASADDYVATATTVTVGDGEDVTDVEIALEGEPGSIAGTVTELDGETPIENATVTLSNEGEALSSVTTDVDGTYRFEPVAHAEGYALSANASGFFANETMGVDVDPAAAVEEVDLSLTREPFVAITAIDAPAEVDRGQNVTLNATVENLGDVSATEPLEYRIDGELEATETLTLEAGEVRHVEFTSAVAENATYRDYEHRVSSPDDGLATTVTVADSSSGGAVGRANLTVSAIDVPTTELEGGESVTVTVFVENTGTRSGGSTFELLVDGERVDSEFLRLLAGQTDALEFEVTLEEPGTYTLEVDGETVILEVVAPDDESVDDPVDDGDAQEADDDVEAGDDDVEDADDSDPDGAVDDGTESGDDVDGTEDADDAAVEPGDDSDTVPGFGVVAVLVALSLALAATVRRR